MKQLTEVSLCWWYEINRSWKSDAGCFAYNFLNVPIVFLILFHPKLVSPGPPSNRVFHAPLKLPRTLLFPSKFPRHLALSTINPWTSAPKLHGHRSSPDLWAPPKLLIDPPRRLINRVTCTAVIARKSRRYWNAKRAAWPHPRVWGMKGRPGTCIIVPPTKTRTRLENYDKQGDVMAAAELVLGGLLLENALPRGGAF